MDKTNTGIKPALLYYKSTLTSLINFRKIPDTFHQNYPLTLNIKNDYTDEQFSDYYPCTQTGLRS